MKYYINYKRREAVYADGKNSRRVKVYSDMVELLTLAPMPLESFFHSGLFDACGFEEVEVQEWTSWGEIFGHLPHSGHPSLNPIEKRNRDAVQDAANEGRNMACILDPRTLKSVLVWVDNIKPVLFVVGTEGMPHLPICNPYYDNVADLKEYLA